MEDKRESRESDQVNGLPTALLLERNEPYETPVLLIYPRTSDLEQETCDSNLESGIEPPTLLLERSAPGDPPVLLIYLPFPGAAGPVEVDP